eukprot:3669131-Pyramimonas_sp.AAC.1
MKLAGAKSWSTHKAKAHLSEADVNQAAWKSRGDTWADAFAKESAGAFSSAVDIAKVTEAREGYCAVAGAMITVLQAWPRARDLSGDLSRVKVSRPVKGCLVAHDVRWANCRWQ